MHQKQGQTQFLPTQHIPRKDCIRSQTQDHTYTLRTRQIALSYRPAETTQHNQRYLYPLPAVLYPLPGDQRFCYPCKRVPWVVPTPTPLINSKKGCASYLRFYGSTALRFYGSTALPFYGSTVLRLYRSTVLRLSAGLTIP